MSTFCQAFIAWKILTTPRIRCAVVGHELTAVQDLYGKLETIIDELPAWFGAEIVAPRKEGRRLTLANKASVRFDSAHRPGKVGRGGTRQILHLTEGPQWANEDESMQAVLEVIRDTPGTYVFVETTAKGASGWFAERFKEGMAKLDRGEEPDYVPVFVAWFKTKEYTRPPRAGERTLSQSECTLRDKYGLTTNQMLWYRDKAAKLKEKVHEEYPFTWREAFLHSGAPFFRTDALEWMEAQVRTPLKQGMFRGAQLGSKRVFEARVQGPTHIFEKRVDGHRYSIGVDLASGTASDFNASVVIDWDAEGGPRIVATHCSKLSADSHLHEAWLLAEYYNKAVMVVDRNGLGEPIVRRLHEEICYPNIYLDRDAMSVKYHGSARRGVSISGTGKKRLGLLEDLSNMIHTQRLGVPCGRLYEECTTFVWVTDDRPEAEGSNHDDLIMGAALAVRGRDQLPTPPAPVVHRRPLTSSRTGY